MRTQRTYRGMPSSTRTYFYFSDMTNVIFSHKHTNDFLSSSIDNVSSLVHALHNYRTYSTSTTVFLLLSHCPSLCPTISLSVCHSMFIALSPLPSLPLSFSPSFCHSLKHTLLLSLSLYASRISR